MNEHTPLPWIAQKFDDLRWVARTEKTFTVISVHENDEANIRFIVKAVNNFEGLVKALETLIEDADAYSIGLSCISCGGEPGEDEDGNHTEIEHEDGCRYEKAKATVAAAKEEG